VHWDYHKSLHDCNLVITATHGEKVVLYKELIDVNATIIALGACRSENQEIDSSILNECFFIADDKAATIQSSGEGCYLANRPSQTINELIDFVTGRMSLPQSGIVLFKSVGLSFQDLMCMSYLYETCKRENLGLNVPDFGGKSAY
jgi:ornithine cyclodeaminase/alanine dehydrogenase-like protein (mu-crystallin family)